MNLELIRNALSSSDSESIQTLLDDEETVFWVDWREEDDVLVEYCEEILQTGELSAEELDADNEAGFELFVQYQERRIKVPLETGEGDRHITLVSINQVLKPDYEIRFCIDSNGSDTLAFLPLPTTDWQALESEFGEAVDKHFYRLSDKPNLFTDQVNF
ncbi:hypothetical protein Pan97_20580 [Bremerella volcania]|uniref:Glutathione reductase n=1 Tax=Bremerella volcania TaxID=2527984 RepID=A0A518C733_9BACT|nr:hypothetical protein [Bremerella volcania]QDU75037.1 hypothetical protein Pan97_20580 [Bremerella volcania]